jgi:FMN phosphatase YigB (HAD superfamily)
VGKPEAAFLKLALSDVGVGPSAAVMVGDDVRDDVGGALACGMAGVLGE